MRQYFTHSVFCGSFKEVNQKTAYISMAADFIHPGLLKLVETASSLGELTVGLLTDKAIASYRSLPVLTFEERKVILERLKGVRRVVPQDELDYSKNLRKFRPHFVVHGNHWRSGPRRFLRDRVIEVLSEWGGELIEPEYTPGYSSRLMNYQAKKMGTTPDIRRQSLRRLMEARPIVRILEAHNGLSGLIVESVQHEAQGVTKEFDGIWISSLTDSTAKGKPDNATVDMTSRIATIEEILEVTTKPLIVDGDNGGTIEMVRSTVRTLDRLGVSALIIEDKKGVKRNSLFESTSDQEQDTIRDFCDKITAGKRAQIDDGFMVIARIESLILGRSMNEALERATSYVGAGADAIMIHSKSASPEEIIEFCDRFRSLGNDIPIVAVPTTYATVSEEELAQAGVRMVIYANHLLRSAYPAMVGVAQKILRHGRCKEASNACMPIKEILSLIPPG